MASVRPVRRADAVLSWWLSATAAQAEALDASVEIADLRELHLPFDDEPDEPAAGRYMQEHTRRWSRTTSVVV